MHGIMTTPHDDHYQLTNATWAHTFSCSLMEKNNKVSYNMTQIASVLTVATVFNICRLMDPNSYIL